MSLCTELQDARRKGEEALEAKVSLPMPHTNTHTLMPRLACLNLFNDINFHFLLCPMDPKVLRH